VRIRVRIVEEIIVQETTHKLGAKRFFWKLWVRIVEEIIVQDKLGAKRYLYGFELLKKLLFKTN